MLLKFYCGHVHTRLYRLLRLKKESEDFSLCNLSPGNRDEVFELRRVLITEDKNPTEI